MMSFLAALDSTVAATAMPKIVTSLGGMPLYAWVFTAYLVPMVVTGPLWGKLADLYGSRPIYLGCWAAFWSGSAACASAETMPWLIAARVLQGVGAGGLVPLGQAILAELYESEARARLQTWITLVYGFASAFGPLLGATLAQHHSWRWVFGLNLPVGLGAFMLLVSSLPAHPITRVKLDVLGAVLFAVLLVVALLLLQEVDHWSAFPGPVMAAWTICALLLAALIAQERRHPDPFLSPALWGFPAWRAAALIMLCGGAMLFGTLVYLPLYCQKVLGQPPSQSAQVVTPLMVCWMSLSAFTARLARRVGDRRCAGLGGLAYLGGFALMLDAGGNPLKLAGAGGLVGLGAGLTMVPMLLAAQASVPRELLGTATAGVLLSRNLGSSVGLAILSALVTGPELSLGLRGAFRFLLGIAVVGLATAWLVPSKQDEGGPAPNVSRET